MARWGIIPSGFFNFYLPKIAELWYSDLKLKNMPKLYVLLTLFLLITISSAVTYAKSDKAANNPQSNKSNNSSNNGLGQSSDRGNNGKKDPQASVSATCAPEAQWKNHGDYVSCVARLHPGGQAVSEAARSDIGKKQKGSTPSGSLKPSPSASSSASPSLSPTPSASGSASLLNTLSNYEITLQIGAIRELFRDFLKNLKHLLTF